MSGQAIRFSFFEITWVVISFLLIAIFYLFVQIKETPPYIVLSESESSFRFDSGSYELSPEYQNALLENIIPQIGKFSSEYDCEVLQIIGHTDGIGMKYKASTLDHTIMSFLHQHEMEKMPLPGSNLDLGMLRAISVANFLKQHEKQMPRIQHYLPYSAGPIIGVDGAVRNEDQPFEDRESRRVELRLTVFGEQSSGY
jgi:hypothetical protein